MKIHKIKTTYPRYLKLNRAGANLIQITEYGTGNPTKDPTQIHIPNSAIDELIKALKALKK